MPVSPSSISINSFDPACRQILSATMATADRQGRPAIGVADVLLTLCGSRLDSSGAPTRDLTVTGELADFAKAGLDAPAFGEFLVNQSRSMTTGAPPEGARGPVVSNELGLVLSAAVNAAPEGELVPLKGFWAALLDDPAIARALPGLRLPHERRVEVLRSWGLEIDDVDPNSALLQYAVDWVEQARSGRMDPVVGRDTELRDLLDILQRRSRNSPLLIGEHGVGKTSLLRALAQAIADDDVPESLKGHALMALDPAALGQGAANRAAIEERVRAMVAEIEERNNVVLVIDDLHALAGTPGSEGAMIGNIIKPLIAKGVVRVVGATTPEQNRAVLEKDPVFGRMLQRVPVAEPSIDEAVAILRAVKGKYEEHHGVVIEDSALVDAVHISARYIGDQRLPDKAFDVLDAAAARVRTALDSRPEELDRLDRRLARLRDQRKALLREREELGALDADATKRLTDIENETQDLDKQVVALSTKWAAEHQVHEAAKAAKAALSAARAKMAQAKDEGDLRLAAHVRTAVIPAAEQELVKARADVRALPDPLVHDHVTGNEVAEVLAKRTGIPVAKMKGGEREKIANLEQVLGAAVIGQDEAVRAVSDAVRRARAGLADGNKPIGSFMFLGPTGVGKTELTKVLAKTLFDQADAMVRIDMSEFMEKHSVSRLIGAPPGYVGYEEGGVLTEAVRTRPYCVVLLDEVEKAHEDVFNILLQVLDDGRLTDTKGQEADFRNAIIIMTSNLGADRIQELTRDNAPSEVVHDAVMDKVAHFFKPEFINRLDETVVFQPLGKAQIRTIADLKAAKVLKRLADRHIDATITPKAIDALATVGFDPLMGARPLNRALQQDLENPLSREIVSGRIVEGSKLLIDANEAGKLTFQATAPAAAVDASTAPEPISSTGVRTRRGPAVTADGPDDGTRRSRSRKP